ncbi:MAG: hypothetical protein JWN84_4215 [Nocardioides sp.]|jgi:hypothetical protein|nr:hypothetical protein [Nocardioides sp.]
MRYRDCPTVEVSARVATTPAEAWAVVTDIEVPARYSPELQRVEWLDGASEVAVGARFRGFNANPHLGEWSTEAEVVEVEPERRWVWQLCFDPSGTPSATWGFEVDPGRDAVTVRHWARMGPGWSGLTPAIESMPDKEARIVANRLAEWQSGMAATLAGVEELLTGR